MRASYAVGPVFSVEFHLRKAALDAEWSPCRPPSAALPGLMTDYKAARNEFLGHVAAGRGAPIAVVDVGEDGCGVATAIRPRTLH